MFDRSPRRGIRATTLRLLALAAILTGSACGKDGGAGPTDPFPSEPGPSEPGPAPSQGPAAVGDVVYAVDWPITSWSSAPAASAR
jgi:hypothetical protein